MRKPVLLLAIMKCLKSGTDLTAIAKLQSDGSKPSVLAHQVIRHDTLARPTVMYEIVIDHGEHQTHELFFGSDEAARRFMGLVGSNKSQSRKAVINVMGEEIFSESTHNE